MLYQIYSITTNIGLPLIRLYLLRRKMRGKEDGTRFAERLGVASIARPSGKLIWCHAASVGEAASALRLIQSLQDGRDVTIILTTGTVTSAQFVATRLPPKTIHQYYPVDCVVYVKRFLHHWRPDLVFWMESELWPNMMMAIRRRSIPAILVNGRMSEKSYRNWRIARGWARQLLGTFALCLAQTARDGERYEKLGAPSVQVLGNIKYASMPLAFDAGELSHLQNSTRGRPLWLMASTHRGEEEIAIKTHQQLLHNFPNLLTIIIPRHPNRGEEIAGIIKTKNLPIARRSAGDSITDTTAIYLADTMGEMGLFYQLSPLVCMGGSFCWAGHNPIEPAHGDCAIIFGPQMENFAEIAHEFLETKSALQIHGADALPSAISLLLDNPQECTAQATRAKNLVQKKSLVMNKIMQAIKPWLDRLENIK